MLYRICLQTPAGEKHSIEVDDKGAPDHAVHTAYRLGMAQNFHWIDGHVKWEKGKYEILVPFHGDGDWISRAHPATRDCGICRKEKEPEAA